MTAIDRIAPNHRPFLSSGFLPFQFLMMTTTVWQEKNELLKLPPYFLSQFVISTSVSTSGSPTEVQLPLRVT